MLRCPKCNNILSEKRPLICCCGNFTTEKETDVEERDTDKIIEFIEMCSQLHGTAQTYKKKFSDEKLEEISGEIDELTSLLTDLEIEHDPI